MTAPIRVQTDLHAQADQFAHAADEIRAIYSQILSDSAQWEKANGQSRDLDTFNEKFDIASSRLKNFAAALDDQSEMLDKAADMYEQARQRAIARAKGGSSSAANIVNNLFKNPSTKITSKPKYDIPIGKKAKSNKSEENSKDSLLDLLSFDIPLLNKPDNWNLSSYRKNEIYEYQTKDGNWHKYTNEDQLDGVDVVAKRKTTVEKNKIDLKGVFNYNPGKGKVGIDITGKYSRYSIKNDYQETTGSIDRTAGSGGDMLKPEINIKVNNVDGLDVSAGFSGTEINGNYGFDIFGYRLDVEGAARAGFKIGAKVKKGASLDLGPVSFGIKLSKTEPIEAYGPIKI